MSANGRAGALARSDRALDEYTPPVDSAPSADTLDLALRELERALPSGRVLRDADSRASYAHDESETTPHLPDAVVRAEKTAEIAAVLRVASAHRIAVTPRAGAPDESAAQSRSREESCSRPSAWTR